MVCGIGQVYSKLQSPKASIIDQLELEVLIRNRSIVLELEVNSPSQTKGRMSELTGTLTRTILGLFLHNRLGQPAALSGNSL